MPVRVIHPSMKVVWVTYVLAVIIVIAAVWAYFNYIPEDPRWLLALPLIVFIPPVRMHIRRRMVTLTLDDDHLTMETGLLSRTRRTLDMAKIQDVTVRQTIGQRLVGVGDLMLETAGEGGAIGMHNLDSPRQVADEIIAASKRAAGIRAHGIP
jgi:putative membrane protein